MTYQKRSTWPPAQSLRAAIATLGASEVYAPNGQGPDYSEERHIERLARMDSEETGEPWTECQYCPRVATYQITVHNALCVPVCEEHAREVNESDRKAL